MKHQIKKWVWLFCLAPGFIGTPEHSTAEAFKDGVAAHDPTHRESDVAHMAAGKQHFAIPWQYDPVGYDSRPGDTDEEVEEAKKAGPDPLGGFVIRIREPDFAPFSNSTRNEEEEKLLFSTNDLQYSVMAYSSTIVVSHDASRYNVLLQLWTDSKWSPNTKNEYGLNGRCEDSSCNSVIYISDDNHAAPSTILLAQKSFRMKPGERTGVTYLVWSYIFFQDGMIYDLGPSGVIYPNHPRTLHPEDWPKIRKNVISLVQAFRVSQ